MARLVEEVSAKKVSKKSKAQTHKEDYMRGFWKRYVEKTLREFTMTDFEKELFLKYLKGGLKIQHIELYETNGTILFKTLEKFFNVDVSEFVFEDECAFDDSAVSYELQEKLEVIVNNIPKIECTDVLKSKFEWIAEIFDFNEIAKEIITFCYMYKKNKCIEFLIDRGFTCSGLRNVFYYIFEDVLKRSDLSAVIRDVTSCGIFTGDEDTISDYYINLLEDENLDTKEKFIKYLTGTVLKSELKLKDFEHIKQISLLQKILRKASEKHKIGVNILFVGKPGTGKSELCKTLISSIKGNLYPVAADSNEREISRENRLADLNTKQAILKRIPNSFLVFDEAEDIFNRGFSEDGRSSKGYMNKLLENNSVPVLYTTNDISNVDSAFLRRMNYILKFQPLSETQRYNMWKKLIKQNDLKISKKKLEELSKSYDVAPALIANAVETTKLVEGDEETFEDVLSAVATGVEKKDDIKNTNNFNKKAYNINLINTDVDIKDLISKIKACGKLNFSMCLYGMPGTSKSSVVSYIADELKLPIIRKKYSDLLDCYVGNSEKLISQAFAQAKAQKGILLIDEAEAFLQNRSMAHARWEISETDQFLAECEHFDYPFIVTTNVMDNIDDAMLRRFTFKLKFLPYKKTHCKEAFKFFFNIDTDFFAEGLTSGDMINVKKQTDFLNITDEKEIIEMLKSEVKLKKDDSLKNNVGF